LGDMECSMQLLLNLFHKYSGGQRSMMAMFPSSWRSPGGRREVVQPFDLLGAQLDAVGGGVLLDPGNPLGAGNRSDVIALREQPGQRDLCRCCSDLLGNGSNLVDDAEIALEVLAGEARVGLAPVVVRELLGRADLAREEAVAERRAGNEADAQLAQQRQQLGIPVTRQQGEL